VLWEKYEPWGVFSFVVMLSSTRSVPPRGIESKYRSTSVDSPSIRGGFLKSSSTYLVSSWVAYW